MNDFASSFSKEFGNIIKPPVSVVAEIIKNSQEIDVCRKKIKRLDWYDEEIGFSNKLLCSRIWFLEELNDDLVENLIN